MSNVDNRSLVATTFLVVLSVLFLADSAYAQQSASSDVAPPRAGVGLEEVVVTAQKREQNLQDVPISVTAISGDSIVNKGITQFENLVAVSPSLTITQATNATNNSINLRGIGTFAFSTGVEPSVAVVVDDVAVLQQAQAFSGLNDIARVEVLRGPQGTLFGKNASAGVINIVTRDPSKTLTGRIGTTVTTDDEYRVEGMVSGPISETAGFRLNAFYGDRAGYVRNLTNGTRLGRDKSWGVQGKFAFEPTGKLKVALAASHTLSKGNGTPRNFLVVPAGATVFGSPLAPSLVDIVPGPDNYAIRQNIDPVTRNEQTSVSSHVAADLGFADLMSITSYQNWKFYFAEDVDATTAAVFGSPTGLLQTSPYHTTEFAQELRLVSKGQSPFQYLLGLFYADGKTDRYFDRGPVGPLVSNWTSNTGTKSYAAFAQGTLDLGRTTHIDSGVRFNREDISVSFQRLNQPATPPANNAICLATCVGNASDDHVTGKVALRKDLAPDTMVYASLATGYKGQGYDVSSGFNPDRAANPVKPETSKAWELGLKSRFLDNRVQLNIATFLVDYNDFQAQSAVVQPDFSVQFKLNNVGKLRTKGVEVELNTKPTDALSFDLSAAYTDAVIREFPLANCYTGQTAAQGCFDIDGAGPGTATAQNLAGKPLANAPKLKLNASVGDDVHLGSLPFDGFVNVDYRYQSSVNFDLAQNPLYVQGPYSIVNASLGIRESRRDAYRITLFVNNLFDKHFAASLGGSTGGSAGVVAQVLSRDSRRYFGIRATYNF